jgi:hypothetical protein
MEIVLAIGLTSVVMYLLMTAIELYMVRVDSSRSRVESAQLARTLLDQIAADLTATRLYAPQAGGMGGGQAAGAATGGQQSGGGAATNGGASGSAGGGMNSGGGGATGSGVNSSGGSSSGGGSTSGGSMLPPASVQGIFGTVDELRIDRAAFPNWQRAAREVLPEEPSTVADMPASVRYYLVDGDRQTSEQLALQGVTAEEATESHAGLYREVYTTAALAGESDPLVAPTQRDGARLELLAPEVVKMEISYFDGTQLVEVWDSLDEGALPAGVEIRLTIYEPSFQDALEGEQETRLAGQPQYRESELVEYRRFVRLPSISPAQAAEALLPMPGNNGGGQAGQPVGGNGGGQNGGDQGQNGGGRGQNGNDNGGAQGGGDD